MAKTNSIMTFVNISAIHQTFYTKLYTHIWSIYLYRLAKFCLDTLTKLCNFKCNNWAILMCSRTSKQRNSRIASSKLSNEMIRQQTDVQFSRSLTTAAMTVSLSSSEQLSSQPG